ncbi:hypothetical protein C0Q70_02702 [Pomacea canaliculata]|uniref:Uncharacterized protein n=1 Tax=Pomacea canaliculata TaxID=400727 RepID=A0A2T7PQN9_POMCA|nr:hypothetical protein C0Q70_02702 [Pomacea canaliculata]
MEETSRGRNVFSPFRYTFHIPLFGVVSQKQSRADGRIKALIRATGKYNYSHQQDTNYSHQQDTNYSHQQDTNYSHQQDTNYSHQQDTNYSHQQDTN